MEGGSFCTPDLLGDTYILGKITQEHVLYVNLSSFAWRLLTLGPFLLFCSLQVYVNKGVFGSKVTRHVATRPNELFWSKDHLVYGQTFLPLAFILSFSSSVLQPSHLPVCCPQNPTTLGWGLRCFSRRLRWVQGQGLWVGNCSVTKAPHCMFRKVSVIPPFVLRNSADVS